MMIVQLFAVCALLVEVNSIDITGPNSRYPPTGGTLYTGGPDVSVTIDLGTDSIVFNGVQYHKFYVSTEVFLVRCACILVISLIQLNTNGYVTFGNKYGKAPMPLTQWDAYYQRIIAAYWGTTEPRCGGVSYRILKRSQATGDEMNYFNNADSDVMHANVPRMGTFEAETLVVINFIGVKPRGSFSSCGASPVSVCTAFNEHTFTSLSFQYIGCHIPTNLGL